MLQDVALGQSYSQVRHYAGGIPPISSHRFCANLVSGPGGQWRVQTPQAPPRGLATACTLSNGSDFLRKKPYLWQQKRSCVTWPAQAAAVLINHLELITWLLKFLLWFCSLLSVRFIVAASRAALLWRLLYTLLHFWKSRNDRLRREVKIDTYVDYFIRLAVIRLVNYYLHSLKLRVFTSGP